MKKFILTNLYLLGTLIATKLALGTTQTTGVAGGTHTTGEAGGDYLELPNPLGTGVQSLGDLIRRIMDALYFVIPPIAVLMVIIGAFQILTAGGDPNKFKTGKNTIIYAVVGIAIFLLADLIIDLIGELLGAQ